MGIQRFRQEFPIVDPKTGIPTEYFLRKLRDSNIFSEDTEEAVQGKADQSTQIIAGTGLTGGGDLSVDRSLTADEQAILDEITTTQGSILYKNASDWVALSPGTSGQFLKTNGAGANPSWAAASGGGGSSGGVFEAAAPDIPVSSSFTWQNQGSAAVSDNTLGMHITDPDDNQFHALMDTSPPSTPYSVYARLEPWMGSTDSLTTQIYSTGALVFWDGSGNAVFVELLNFRNIGDEQNSYYVQAFESTFTLVGFSSIISPYRSTIPYKWLRADNDGTDLTVYVSQNGLAWEGIGTITIASHLTSVTQVGIASRSKLTGFGALEIYNFGYTTPS